MHTLKILIVEDDPIIAEDIKDRVIDMGYEAVGLFDIGETAFSTFEDLKPDLAILDINLAGHWDGIETARQILTKKNLPIIFLNSNSDDATFAQAKLTKPAALIYNIFSPVLFYLKI